MKTAKHFFSLFFAGLLMVTLYSCQPDGIATESSLEGIYSLSEKATPQNSSTPQNSAYNINVFKTGNAGESYRVENFYNLGFSYSITFTRSGSSIDIPSQKVAGFTLSGSGTVTTAGMSLNYRAVDAAGLAESCSATATRQ